MTTATRALVPCLECDGDGYLWYGREALGSCPPCHGTGFVSMTQAMAADKRLWLSAAFWFAVALVVIVVWVVMQP